jgi:hypothetical protein
MEKEFVPYEQALALKELGFDESCFGKYYYVKEHEVDDPRRGETFIFGDNNKIILKDNNCNYGHDYNDITLCVAPLYQQVFKWFRNKYNYSGNIDCCDKLSEWNIKSSKLDKSIFSNCIQSYEEAQIECLNKLIEIVKYE